MADTAYNRVIDTLRDLGAVTEHNGTARAKCPAHNGNSSTSLAIRPIDGRVLLYCHAGCATPDVVAALNMTMADLFDDGRGRKYRYPQGRIVSRYYLNGPNKQMAQSGIKTDTSLYGSEHIKPDTKIVLAVEGEQDVDAARSIGLVAVSSAMGAGKAAKFDWSCCYGHPVMVVADKDAPGRAHAAQVVSLLNGHVPQIGVVEAAGNCHDLAEHVAAGHGITELIPIDLAPTYDGEPPPDDHHGGEYTPGDSDGQDDAGGDNVTTWEPVDLGPYLRGEIQRPQPSIGAARTDGLHLIYPGREHAILGETESGKSWLALLSVIAELTRGHWVVYIHYEEGDPGSTIERLLLLGADPAAITERLRFVAPSKPVQADWVDALLDPAPTLVIHDGINEAMALIGADIMAIDGAANFKRRLVTPFLRAGAASIACDHFPKDRDGRGRDAYGSVHKGNALDGARIVLGTLNRSAAQCAACRMCSSPKTGPASYAHEANRRKHPAKHSWERSSWTT